MYSKNCLECGCELGERGKTHTFCVGCITAWHLDADLPDGVLCADYDEPRLGHEE